MNNKSVTKSIVIYSPGAFKSYGHSFDYCKGLSESLMKLGYKVYVFGLEGDLEFCEKVIQKKLWIQSANQKKRTLTQKMIWGLNRINNSFHIHKEFKKFYLSIENEPLILFETFEYFTLSSFLKNYKNKYICIFHDTNFNFKQTSLMAGIYKYLARIPSRKIVRNSICTFVHGFEMKKNLTKQLGKSFESKIIEIPYGSPMPKEISQDRIMEFKVKMNLNKEKFYILSFGTLRTDKNYEPIFKALSTTENWHLILAGPEGDISYNDLMLKAEKFNIEHKILTYPRFIKNEEQEQFFAVSDVVVNAYKDYIRHESGTVQLARTYLKPVAVSGPPDLTMYVKDLKIGWVMNEKLPLSDILKQIENLGVKEKLEISQNIKKLAELKSWDTVVNTILKAI